MVLPKIISWNAHSLDIYKREELFHYMEQSGFAIAGISETWKIPSLDPIYDSQLSGMTARGFQHHSGRRGLGCFSIPQVPIRQLKEFSLQTEAFTMLTFKLNQVVIVFVYMPNGSVADAAHQVCDKLQLLELIYSKVIVLGDLNARMNVIQNEGFNSVGRVISTFLQHSNFQ